MLAISYISHIITHSYPLKGAYLYSALLLVTLQADCTENSRLRLQALISCCRCYGRHSSHDIEHRDQNCLLAPLKGNNMRAAKVVDGELHHPYTTI